MTLHEHYKASGLTRIEWAKTIGMPLGRLIGYMHQGRRPTIDIVHAIELATEGKVQPIDWAEPALRLELERLADHDPSMASVDSVSASC